jgi:hypothetical protein
MVDKVPYFQKLGDDIGYLVTYDSDASSIDNGISLCVIISVSKIAQSLKNDIRQW